MRYQSHHDVIGKGKLSHFFSIDVAQHRLAISQRVNSILQEIFTVWKKKTSQSYIFQLRLKSRESFINTAHCCRFFGIGLCTLAIFLEKFAFKIFSVTLSFPSTCGMSFIRADETDTPCFCASRDMADNVSASPSLLFASKSFPVPSPRQCAVRRGEYELQMLKDYALIRSLSRQIFIKNRTWGGGVCRYVFLRTSSPWVQKGGGFHRQSFLYALIGIMRLFNNAFIEV